MDRSSSMWEIKDEILQSVNDRFQSIKKMEKEKDSEILTDLTLFNERVSRVFTLLTQEEIELLTSEDYQVNGTTALYDALGSTLEKLYLNFYQDIESGDCKVVVVVYTDGYENASRMYSNADIRRMLSKANNMEGVEISIVGCEEETLTMAQSMNFKGTNVVRVKKESFASSMKEMDQYFDDFRKDKLTNFKESMRKFDLDLKKDEDTTG